MSAKMHKDWRADIKDINDLNDLDPLEIMIFLRHQYLESAKAMASDDFEWQDLGEMCCRVAEYLDIAIEAQLRDYSSLEMFR